MLDSGESRDAARHTLAIEGTIAEGVIEALLALIQKANEEKRQREAQEALAATVAAVQETEQQQQETIAATVAALQSQEQSQEEAVAATAAATEAALNNPSIAPPILKKDIPTQQQPTHAEREPDYPPPPEAEEETFSVQPTYFESEPDYPLPPEAEEKAFSAQPTYFESEPDYPLPPETKAETFSEHQTDLDNPELEELSQQNTSLEPEPSEQPTRLAVENLGSSGAEVSPEFELLRQRILQSIQEQGLNSRTFFLEGYEVHRLPVEAGSEGQIFEINRGRDHLLKFKVIEGKVLFLEDPLHVEASLPPEFRYDKEENSSTQPPIIDIVEQETILLTNDGIQTSRMVQEFPSVDRKSDITAEVRIETPDTVEVAVSSIAMTDPTPDPIRQHQALQQVVAESRTKVHDVEEEWEEEREEREEEVLKPQKEPSSPEREVTRDERISLLQDAYRIAVEAGVYQYFMENEGQSGQAIAARMQEVTAPGADLRDFPAEIQPFLQNIQTIRTVQPGQTRDFLEQGNHTLRQVPLVQPERTLTVISEEEPVRVVSRGMER